MATRKPARGAPPGYDDRVFLNVPFDDRYRSIFRALVFAVHDCGFQARCALEADDGSVVRMLKLFDIIESSRFGIHDISRTSLDAKTRLPRFNMPLELGMFLGAKRYGAGSQERKACLILDSTRFRYQKFCSDIAGQDIRAHANKSGPAIKAVRNWLQVAPGRQRPDMPSPKKIIDRYAVFTRELPALCRRRGLDVSDLPFFDFQTLVVGWLKANPDWN